MKFHANLEMFIWCWHVLQIFVKFRKRSIKIGAKNDEFDQHVETKTFLFQTLWTRFLRVCCWNFKVWAFQKYVNLVDLVKSFPTGTQKTKKARVAPKEKWSQNSSCRAVDSCMILKESSLSVYFISYVPSFIFSFFVSGVLLHPCPLFPDLFSK